MSRLVTPDGQILVSGVKDLIAPVTDDERAKFEAIHFEMQDIHAAVGGEVTISDDTVKTVSFLDSEKKNARVFFSVSYWSVAHGKEFLAHGKDEEPFIVFARY